MMHGYALTQPHAFSLSHSLLGNGLAVFPLMGFLLLIVIGLVIWFVVRQNHVTTADGHHYMTATPTNPTAPTPQAPTDPAESIVRDRFARGEIDSEEYARLISALRNH